MAKKKGAITHRHFSLVHLLSRLFLTLVLILLLVLAVSFVLAADGQGLFLSSIQSLRMGALLVATPLTALMIVIAAYQYMTAALDPDQVKQAKETIVYALGGLVLLILGFQILQGLIYGQGSPLELLRNISPFPSSLPNVSLFPSAFGSSHARLRQSNAH